MKSDDVWSVSATAGDKIKTFNFVPDYSCDVARHETALHALGFVERLIKDGMNPLEAIQSWKAVYEELRDKAEENLKKQGEV